MLQILAYLTSAAWFRWQINAACAISVNCHWSHRCKNSGWTDKHNFPYRKKSNQKVKWKKYILFFFFSWIAIWFRQTISSLNTSRLLQCYTLVTMVIALRPIPHAGNILINLDDDSATLDGNGSTLIGNEAIEQHDELRGRKFVSTWLMK